MATKETKRTTKKATTTKSPATKRPSRTTSQAASSKTTMNTSSPVVKHDTKTTSPASSTTSSTPKKSTGVKKSYIALIAIILLLGAGLYYFRGVFVAAVVNGQPISRLEVVRQTEQQSGKQTLDTLVRNSLIEQKARQENVSVTDQEINDEIKKLNDNLSKQGQNLDQVLQAQGMTQDDLKKLIRLDKLVSKMVGKDVQVSDDEVNAYIEQNKDALPAETSEEELKTQVTEQLKQQKTNEKVRTWLADLQKQANVTYFVQY